MALVYKMLESGEGIEVDESGRPIVFDDEQENEKPFGLDAIHLYSKIPALNEEAKKYREERNMLKSHLDTYAGLSPNEVKEKLEAYAGLDPQEARKALETVANLGQLDKERSVKVEEIKAKTGEAYETKIKDLKASFESRLNEVSQTLAQKDGAIRQLLVKGAFDRSEFIKNHTVVPAEMAYRTFGDRFQIEEKDGNIQVYALNNKGEQIYSMAKPGEPAPPEEAIEVLINEWQYKDSILKTSQGGSGAGGNISPDATKRQRQKELASMGPSERLNALRR